MKRKAFTRIKSLVAIAVVVVVVTIDAAHELRWSAKVEAGKGQARPLSDLRGKELVVKVDHADCLDGMYYVFLREVKDNKVAMVPRIYSVSTNETVMNLEVGKLYKTKAEYTCNPANGQVFVSWHFVPFSLELQ
jgi:hypothetical protein